MYKIVFYEKESGEAPALDFIKNTEPKIRSKITRALKLLEEKGPLLSMPNSKPLGNKLFEIRVIQGNNIARVLYFFVFGKTIVLTNGFIKKSDKTPASVIELANKYRFDYERRLLK